MLAPFAPQTRQRLPEAHPVFEQQFEEKAFPEIRAHRLLGGRSSNDRAEFEYPWPHRVPKSPNVNRGERCRLPSKIVFPAFVTKQMVRRAFRP